MNVLLCEGLGGENEYIELLASAYQKQGHSVVFGVQNFLFSDFMPDFVHVQWPESIYRWRHSLPPTEDTLQLLSHRLLNYSSSSVPIVYTVHNLLPHENVTDFDRAVFHMVFRYADIIVHHGTTSVSMVMREFPECADAQHIICPHGPYPYVAADAQQARGAYRLPHSKYVFLNFGRQRPYKGPDFVRRVFRRWTERKAYLFSIGSKSLKLQHKGTIHNLAAILNSEAESRVAAIASHFSRQSKTILRPVPSEEVPRVMAAVDVFFLGHQRGLNSGLAVLAASYGKPVVFPDLGNFKEHLVDWPWQESYEAGNVDSAIEALRRMRRRIEQYPPGSVGFDNTEWLSSNSWDKHVRSIVEAVQRLRG